MATRRFLALCLWASLLRGGKPEGGGGRLYSPSDPLSVLSGSSLTATVSNSSCGWLVQFMSSWCGHCVQFSPTWKALARDVQDWQQAVKLAVLDCAQEINYDVCKEYNIQLYPTFKYFPAYSPPTDKGTTYTVVDRDVQSVRQLMVDILQNHSSHTPALQPYSSVQILPLLGQRSDHYTAIIVEDQHSYVGREVTLDMWSYSGVHVRRVLGSDAALLDTLNITALPHFSLLNPDGTHAHVDTSSSSAKPLRFFITWCLRSLPGVRRRFDAHLDNVPAPPQVTAVPSSSWTHVDSSKVYMADLESALHYILRVELASHPTMEGEELQVLKDFVTLIAKLYPGGGPVVKLMERLSDWLNGLPLKQIAYQAVLDLLDNKMRTADAFLSPGLNWVGCRGSREGLRGYPCAFWTLFHVLTVQQHHKPQALANTGLAGARGVLTVMRGYMRHFFGCRQCGRHFDSASTTLTSVNSTGEQLLWLWHVHNQVNLRLAGSLSDDPGFPKRLWPDPSMCAPCHEEQAGARVWVREEVSRFLQRHYADDNLSSRTYTGTFRRLPADDDGEKLAGFSGVELSLCVVLYVSSCVVLLFLFFFRVRARRWKPSSSSSSSSSISSVLRRLV
ncbi:sulfhydryl oxidase 2 [Hippocampus comes]|uniref:sulfhydryl oxidase 2 n=1 Tax=Hippocampus comes TaxID=109280 RepID=UPI00094EAA6C|nr:PREDICTED: sulfhydryl oxidase 2-like [Hippocampus comes]